MGTFASQDVQQPAASEQVSPAIGSVAPPVQSEQSYGEAPGIPPARVISSPTGPVQQGTAPATPAEPTVDHKALYEQERNERLRLEGETNQFRQAIGQFQQQTQEQQSQQNLKNQVTMALAAAEAMPTDKANEYLTNQVLGMVGGTRAEAQQTIQQIRQQAETEKRAIAAPLYADHLAQTLGLSDEAKKELLQISRNDPDLMYANAPILKTRYDAFGSQIAELKQGQQQIARTTEVNALRQAGMGAIGGQTGAGEYQLEVSDDPDVRAMQILQFQRGLGQR